MPQRVAFVTGASRGIGRAITLALSRVDFDVVAAATTLEGNQEFADAIRAGGANSFGGLNAVLALKKA